MKATLASGVLLSGLLLLSACQGSVSAPEDAFAGTWRWVASEGGIAGAQHDPISTGFTVTLEYDLNGTVRGFRDDELVATTNYTALQRLSITTNEPEWEVTYDPPLNHVFGFTSLDEHVVQTISQGVIRFIEPCCDRYVHVFTGVGAR